jgi:hypothetical protein
VVDWTPKKREEMYSKDPIEGKERKERRKGEERGREISEPETRPKLTCSGLGRC